MIDPAQSDMGINDRKDLLPDYLVWVSVFIGSVVLLFFSQEVGGAYYLGPKKIALLTSEVLGTRKEARILDLGAGTGLCGEEVKTIYIVSI
jgi:hypothetical protein